jgi:CrcB protein
MNWLAVALGGALGSLLRYAVAGVWLSPASLDFPWGTLAVNITGSFALGFLGRVFAPPHAPHAWFLFFTVGVCGGYTTFSTFALDAFTLAERSVPLRAVVYLLASVLGSYLAVIGGYTMGRALRPPA